jgi:hypothetical protein
MRAYPHSLKKSFVFFVLLCELRAIQRDTCADITIKIPKTRKNHFYFHFAIIVRNMDNIPDAYLLNRPALVS